MVVKAKDDKKGNGASQLPLGFGKVLARVVLTLTFLDAFIVYFGCENYRAQFNPGTSQMEFFPTAALIAGLSAGCFFLTAFIVFSGIVRLFFVVIGKIKNMSPVDWFYLADFVLLALIVPGVLKALNVYRYYHPAPANEIFAEKYFVVIFTLCLVSFGGMSLVAYIGQKIDGSIE